MRSSNRVGDRVFVIVNYIFVSFLVLVTLYPFWDLLILSVSSKADALKGGIRIITLQPDLSGYIQVLNSPEVWRSLYNSVVRVVGGTLISVFLTSLTAYPLSKKDLPMNKIFTAIILFTMMFSGGLIPGYLLMKSLHLLDKMWVLILPGAIGAYNLIIMRNFLWSIPSSLEESAKIDGASDFIIWHRIVIPLSMPAIATIALWVAVGHWNAYFDALIYITDRSKFVLPVILRRVLLENQIEMFLPGQIDTSGVLTKPTAETVKAAVIMVSTLPILVFYPFIQKYFTKGIMLGSIKG